MIYAIAGILAALLGALFGAYRIGGKVEEGDSREAQVNETARHARVFKRVRGGFAAIAAREHERLRNARGA